MITKDDCDTILQALDITRQNFQVYPPNEIHLARIESAKNAILDIQENGVLEMPKQLSPLKMKLCL